MQIITINDSEFSELLNSFQKAQAVGTFSKNGQIQILKASSRFLMLLDEKAPNRISIRPTRSLADSIAAALKILEQEKNIGTKTEIFIKLE